MYTRSASPIWFFDNLVGQPFDDTYYAFFLTNTLPYLPQTVYQDPNGVSAWASPLEFQPSSGLPNNLYFNPSQVYRIEFRKGPDQTSPLIWLVEDYSPPPVVMAGTAGQLAYYATNGNILSGGQLDNVLGTATNDNAPTGYVGEFITSSVLSASAISCTTTVLFDLTTIFLTAGDWEVWGSIFFNGSGQLYTVVGWVNTVSVTNPDLAFIAEANSPSSGGPSNCAIVPMRFSLASTTTIYLTGNTVFGSGTITACGFISARRIR